MKTLLPNRFDSKIFGVPAYTVAEFDERLTPKELEALTQTGSHIVAAKTSRDDLHHRDFLQRNAFKLSCTQVVLELPSSRFCLSVSSPTIKVEHKPVFTQQALAAHGANFTQDRYSVDGRFTPNKVSCFYSEWIKNSIENEQIYFVRQNDNFISFRQTDGILTIDLTSILEKRMGFGSRLLKRLINEAHSRKCTKIVVKTEENNLPALELYKKHGFIAVDFVSCFFRIV